MDILFWESSEVDESSVLVQNTGLKPEELDKKAVVYKSVFFRCSQEDKTLVYFHAFRDLYAY